MSTCPCNALKLGAAQLAVPAAMLAQSRMIFGGPAGPVIAAALHGAVPLPVALLLVGCAALIVSGACSALAGYRAAQTHYDAFDPVALAWSGGGCVLFLYAVNQGWGLDPLAWGSCIAALSRAVLLAGLAYNVAGLWLQLRYLLALLVAEFGPSPAPAPPPWDAPPHDAAQLAEYREVMGALTQEVEQSRNALVTWQQAVAERDAAIAGLTDERNRFADDLTHAQAARDRYQAHGKQYKARSAQSDCLLQFPGALKALEKAVHPNAHGGADPQTLQRAHDAFCALADIRERLQVRR
jgi:hypothetical protein